MARWPTYDRQYAINTTAKNGRVVNICLRHTAIKTVAKNGKVVNM